MKLILGIVVFSVLISQTSLLFGVTQEVWETPESIESPTEDAGGGFFGAVEAAIKAVLAPFRWVFNTVAVVFMFLTYQVDGVHPIINTVIISPIGAAILWQVVRLIRGGG